MPSHPNARKPQPARPAAEGKAGRRSEARPDAEESVSATTPTPTILGSLLPYLADTPHVHQVLAMSLGGPLSGHTTSEAWLPKGLSRAIDKLRAEHLRRRDQVVDAIVAVDDLRTGFKAEDREFAEAQKAAYRVGDKQPSDERTPEAAREALITGAEERKWAAVDVLGEHVAAVIDVIRRDEDQLLNDLKRRLAVSDEERLAAMRRVDEARVAGWQAMQQAQWVLGTADGAGTVFSNQPCPVPSRPPDQFNEGLLATAFERHWTNPKPERTFVSELADSSQIARQRRGEMPDVDDLDDGGPDDVSELISTRGAAA